MPKYVYQIWHIDYDGNNYRNDYQYDSEIAYDTEELAQAEVDKLSERDYGYQRERHAGNVRDWTRQFKEYEALVDAGLRKPGWSWPIPKLELKSDYYVSRVEVLSAV